MHMLTPLLLLSGSLATCAVAQLSDRARSLGLNQTWRAPFSATEDAPSFIANHWGVSSKTFYGYSDVDFESDPITNNGSETVMSVLYAAGSYSPSGTKTNDGSLGGTEFSAFPFGEGSYDSALLSYDLAFADNFNWIKGGKLPGIFGGTNTQECSGGNKADGSNCFSVRLMWRELGGGEAYAYLPDNSICGSRSTVCNDEYGISFSRGVIQFKTSQWTKIEIYVKINNATESNGVLMVWQDGSLVINQPSLKFRTRNSIAATSIMFSTFFGGGETDYATSVDTFTYYKNIEFSVGNQVELSDSASTRLTTTMFSLAALAMVAGFFLLL